MQEPTTHSFVFGKKVVNIIDTPGIGGGDSYEEEENMNRILDHISRIKVVHAICILLNSNRARLGAVFRLLEYVHRDTAPNIVFCFTHIRGNLLMPGETIPMLRQELIDREVGIELDRSKMYFFDNEPFQVLLWANFCQILFELFFGV